MKTIKKLRNKATSTLLLASLTTLTHSMHGGNIAYIHGDVAITGAVPSGSLPAFEQMLLTDNSVRGMSQFKAMVEGEGHTINQYYDQATTLDAAFLNQFDAVVFGLHQKIWSAAEKSALDAWLQAGGGAMGYSDSAVGGGFGDVGIDNPVGQNVFNNLFSQYSMTVTVDQASGTLVFESQDPNPNPIVAGLQFEGEGVSPIVVDSTDPLVEVLIPFNDASAVSKSAGIIWSNNGGPQGNLRVNPEDDRFQGVTIPYGNVIPSPPRVDACIALRPVGNGNVIGIFDRQPLFNQGGPGSDITQRDNEEILRRIINFLAGESNTGGNGDYIALSRTNWIVSASLSSSLAGSAIDGDAATRWITGTAQAPGQTFTIDLGTDETFSRLVLETAANPNDYPRGYTVSVSSDGTNYTSVSTGTGSGTPTEIIFTEQTARYIQIEQTGSAAFNWWSIHEINVYEEAPTANTVALPRTNWMLTASQSNNITNAAIDGNAATRWATGQIQTPGQLFTIDLGTNERFSEIVMETAANPNDYPRGYNVSVSTDGVNYTSVATGTGSGTPTEITFAEETARYIQIEQTGTAASSWWSIHEINVFQTTAPGNSGPDYVSLRKRNAMGFAMASDSGAPINGDNVYMFTFDPNEDTQQWEEISRGNDFYTYKRKGTIYVLDGGGGVAENDDNVKLWNENPTNQNQHWKKIDMGDGYYRLEKRNADTHSIDGSGGGADFNNVKLWNNNNANFNQHWSIE